MKCAKIFTTLLLFGAQALSLSADAATFKRFWRGYRLPTLSQAKLV